MIRCFLVSAQYLERNFYVPFVPDVTVVFMFRTDNISSTVVVLGGLPTAIKRKRLFPACIGEQGNNGNKVTTGTQWISGGVGVEGKPQILSSGPPEWEAAIKITMRGIFLNRQTP